jgi:hypothetical protein
MSASGNAPRRRKLPVEETVGLAILNKRPGTEIALFEAAHQAHMPSW